jgi:hypothetical protein
MGITRTERHELAKKRLINVLRKHGIATARTLEMKISDAGPFNQRIDPHILTEARDDLIDQDIIQRRHDHGTRWFNLTRSEPLIVESRLTELGNLHRQTTNRLFGQLIGQTLEIAVFRALESQNTLDYFGNYPNLDAHDDSTLYSKEEPPSFLSGRRLTGNQKLDFLVNHRGAGYAGIEVKNVREWFYPNRSEIRELLIKCCALDVVPVLIARRIHFSTFSVLNPCGVIVHETFNQLYPYTGQELADQVKQKTLLGYHDVHVGNAPDDRLINFTHNNLPAVLPKARQIFDAFKDLLCAYSSLEISYESFAARVKRRMRGEPEDLPDFEEGP